MYGLAVITSVPTLNRRTMELMYYVVSIKRTGSLNYFEVFYHPDRFFFHVLNEIFAPP